MKEKLKISTKSCYRCNGLISWDKKIEGKFPTHVDKEGHIIGDGSCPKFKRSQSSQVSGQISIFKTQKFNRFNLKQGNTGYTLPIFQNKEPLIPRFYIGKISLELAVYKKIIKIPKLFKLNIWRLAYSIVRRFLEQHKVVLFFKII